MSNRLTAYLSFIAVIGSCLGSVEMVSAAADKWNGSGWYQTVAYVTSGASGSKSIYRGPYASEALCLKDLHPDYTSPGYDEEDPDTVHDFSCEELTSRPDWD